MSESVRGFVCVSCVLGHVAAAPWVDACRVVARVGMGRALELQGICLTGGLDAVLSLYRSCCVEKDRRVLIGATCGRRTYEWPGAEIRNEIWEGRRGSAMQVGLELDKVPCGQ